jgi:hypothetical protein
MLDNPVIDVVLGLVLIYIVLALVCSAVQEWVAGLCGLRSKNLRRGIENLLGGDLAEEVYRHPLVAGLSRPNGRPSYISARTFSNVVLEVLAKDKTGKSHTDLTAEELRDLIGRIPEDNPIRGVLESLVDTAQGEVDALKRELAEHFDEAMERVAGWYKRTVTYWLLGIALIVTVATNASTVHIVAALWEHDALRTSLAAQAQALADSGSTDTITDAAARLQDYPIGWGAGPPGSAGAWVATVFGWAVTTAAVSLGAPFWFDLLGKVARLRSAGGRPERQANRQSDTRAARPAGATAATPQS